MTNKTETKLTLEIIESFGMAKRNWKPDHDDMGYLFTLPKSGHELSTLFVCCGEHCESDSLEGVDGWIYINTQEELEVLLTLDENQLFEYIEAENPEFEREEHE